MNTSKVGRLRRGRGLHLVTGIALLFACGGAAPSAAQSAQDLFAPIAEVMRHPRCVNCHVKGDAPLNGDDGHAHPMRIVRGADGLGAPAARCYACHRDAAIGAAPFVPAAPNWKLAPVAMAWQVLTTSELCEALSNQIRNGKYNETSLREHFANDKAVGTAWQAGGGRTPVSTPRQNLVAAVARWTGAGRPCPGQ
jgi:hypothetical protein